MTIVNKLVSELSDDDLLEQINCHDPYDVEFARRYREQQREIKRLRAKVKSLTPTLEFGGAVQECETFLGIPLEEAADMLREQLAARENPASELDAFGHSDA